MEKSEFIGGALWSALNAVVSVVAPFVMFLIAARNLTPTAIGLVGIAVAMGELLKALAPQGLYETLLGADTTEAADRGAVTILLVAAAVICVVFEVCLWWRSTVDAEIAIIRLPLASLGLRSFFDLVGMQPQAVLARRRSFDRIALRTIGSNITAVICGAVLSVLGRPLEGLILYYLILSVVSFLFVCVGTGALVRPSRDLSDVRHLFGEASYSSAVRLVAAANNYLDQVLISAFVSSTALGFFILGKRFETALVTGSSSFSSVLFQPIFAGAPKAERDNFIKNGLIVISLIFMLPVIVLVVTGPTLIPAMFGERWSDAVPIVRLLVIGGLFRVFGGLFGALLSATGRNRPLFFLSLCSSVVNVVAVLTASYFGVLWIGMTIALKSLIFFLLEAHVAVPESRVIGSHLGRIVFLNGIITAAVCWAVFWACSGVFTSPLGAVVVPVGAAGLAATAAMLLVNLSLVLNIILKKRKNTQN